MPRRFGIVSMLFALGGLLGPVSACATDGYFDPSWPGAGRFAFNGDYSNPGNLSSINAIVTETTGRLFLVGRANGGHEYWWLGQLSSDGQFVSTFGAPDLSGRITSCAFFSCVADDQLWTARPYSGNEYLALASHVALTTANAHSLATSVGGSAQINDAQGSVSADAIAVQTDGKVLAAGTGHYSLLNPTPRFGVMRLTSGLASLDHMFNGVTDNLGTTFDGGAVITVDASDTFEVADSVLVQPNNRIVLIGRGGNTSVDPGTEDLELVGLHSDGSLDATFGVGGIKKFDVGDRVLYVNAIVDRGGQIWIATQGATNPFLFLIVRVSADGNAGMGKIIDTGATGCTFQYVVAAAVDSGGRVLAVGTCYVASHFYFVVARLRGDTMALDTSFGINGISRGSFDDTSTQDYGFSVTFDAGGRPVIGGNTTPAGAASPKAGIARLTYDLLYTNDFEAAPRGCLPPNCN